MQYGLFTMPSHPPERSLYDGHRWDLQTLRWADELGFSEAWIGEHHTAPWEPHPAPDLLIAQSLMETSRIRLAPGGFLLPYHHPAELAHRVAMLDHMAQGRLNFGVAASGLPSDWAMFNVDGMSGQHREMTRESLEIILRLWSDEPEFDYKGKYWHVTKTGTMLGTLGRQIDGVLYVDVPDDALVERLSGRLICRPCFPANADHVVERRCEAMAQHGVQVDDAVPVRQVVVDAPIDVADHVPEHGPVLGDEIEAQFAFPNGVHGTFTSRGRNRETAGLWGIEINGSKGAVRILADIRPRLFVRENVPWSDTGAKIDWQPLRHFWFTSKAGKRIHNMIALPPNFDERRKYPLLVMMHGGPHTMFRDNWGLRWNYHLLARPGYVLLLTNYSGSTGFGEAFAQSIQGDPLKGPANEINEAADEAIRLYPFVDGSRQAAAGASYGGHLANWMQATTTRYKALISHAGLINLESQWGTSDIIYHREVNSGGPVWEQAPVWREQNPIRFAKNFRTPILLSIGENDFRVPLNQTLENWSVLQRLRIPSRLVVWPDENHWILKGENSRYFYQEVHGWLKKYLDEPSGVTSVRQD